MLLLLLVVEPLALVALYEAEVGLPNRFDERPSAQHDRVAYSPPAPMHTSLSALAQPMPTNSDAAELQGTMVPSSHISEVRGKYVIELHGATIAGALDMLSKATHTTVTGADVLAGAPDRLSRSLIASSRTEAWQAVFGDVANFALDCSSNGCAAHFAAAGTRHQPTTAAALVSGTQAVSVSMPEALAEPRNDTLVSEPESPPPQRDRRSRD